MYRLVYTTDRVATVPQTHMHAAGCACARLTSGAAMPPTGSVCHATDRPCVSWMCVVSAGGGNRPRVE